MITEEQFLERVGELVELTQVDMHIAAKKLLRSGAVDLEQYDVDYVLPKLFMIAYAERLKRHWSPICGLTREHEEEVEKIGVFI